MATNAGIWIDHARAIVVRIRDDESSVQEIESNVESHRKSLGSSGVRPPGHLHGDASDRFERRRDAELKRYYEKVAKACAAAERVVVIGPGLAPGELAKHWRARKPAGPSIDAVETADHMTQRQIVAKVKAMLETTRKASRRKKTGKRLRHVRQGRKHVTEKPAAKRP
jgi:stalled ribosome rescue protein Dom34